MKKQGVNSSADGIRNSIVPGEGKELWMHKILKQDEYRKTATRDAPSGSSQDTCSKTRCYVWSSNSTSEYTSKRTESEPKERVMHPSSQQHYSQ